MGKPYSVELQNLQETYAWACALPLVPLAYIVEALGGRPLLVIGSGGSLTVAHMTVLLHQKYAQFLAKTMTPMELTRLPSQMGEDSMLLLSASGENPDILSACRAAGRQEHANIAVMCGNPQSTLSQLVRSFPHMHLIDIDLPTKKDGFLATNSLMAFSTLLCRAYQHVYSSSTQLPRTIQQLFGADRLLDQSIQDLREQCELLWTRETLLVLYGPSTQPAAADIESRFAEAALGAIQIADYRNFGHGRHHWLAKRGVSTAVLAMIAQEDTALAARTLRLIPPHIPVLKLQIPHRGEHAALSATISTLYMAGFAGEARGIDPGRPGVPAFGSKMYRLTGLETRPSRSKHASALMDIAVRRKSFSMRHYSHDHIADHLIKRSYTNFIEEIGTTGFRAVVLDYDGTICEPERRFLGIDDNVAQRILTLLQYNTLIGIATGRGRSVKNDLRGKIHPKYWDRIVIGYYNGSFIENLTIENNPSNFVDIFPDLLEIKKILSSHDLINFLAKIAYREKQISITPNSSSKLAMIWDLVQQLIMINNGSGITAVLSSHSIDILAPSVSKVTLVRYLERTIGDGSKQPILCIGDKGKWPGNDFALLSEPHALSVDEVSANIDTCWNLAPAGVKGVPATLIYLAALRNESEVLRLDVEALERLAR